MSGCGTAPGETGRWPCTAPSWFSIFFWTLIFFNLQNYALAFFWLLALWLLILLTTLQFFKETTAAGWLLVPYLAWVAFAGYLNAGVWLLNP